MKIAKIELESSVLIPTMFKNSIIAFSILSILFYKMHPKFCHYIINNYTIVGNEEIWSNETTVRYVQTTGTRTTE